MQNRCAEIKIRAERKAGELLQELERHPPGPLPIDKSHDGTQPPRLEDLGITKNQSSRWQAIAGIPEKNFEERVEEIKGNGNELTSKEFLSLAGYLQRQQAIREQEQAVEQVGPLPTGSYNVIVIDPPWRYSHRPTDFTKHNVTPYPTLSVEEIKALPVHELAANDAILWLWTTNAHLPDAFEIINAWNFTYKTLLTWAKPRMGTGDWLRGKTEHCLLCVKGRPIINLTNQTTLLVAPTTTHSRKPNEFY